MASVTVGGSLRGTTANAVFLDEASDLVTRLDHVHDDHAHAVTATGAVNTGINQNRRDYTHAIDWAAPFTINERMGPTVINTGGIARIDLDPAIDMSDARTITARTTVPNYERLINRDHVVQQSVREVSQRVERQVTSEIDAMVDRIVGEIREDIYVFVTGRVKEIFK
jgi:hypothetical protein